ncbi:MAG TPA: hypothetical protein VKD26_09940 [Streptosporangiaceae bacterium]|nr:hypothetical protein [Streptosporangiaceae bacterium]
MRPEPSEPCRRLLALQSGVIARWQAPAVGLGTNAVEAQLRNGRWRPLCRGVYATFTGDPARLALLWAAVLGAGPRAILSHETAAELDGLLDRPATMIHITVPDAQRVRVDPGVTVHRSRRIEQARHPGLAPPRTMIEETVLDLAQAASTFDDAFSWASRACQRELTTPVLLRMRMDMRSAMRWRGELGAALQAVWDGAHSILEYRYLRDVERAHGLPQARRQVRASQRGSTVYRDVLYEKYRVAIELDGQASHPAEQRWRDIDRDNVAAAAGIVTLRYTWIDVTRRPCAVASEVSAVLQRRGWRGEPHPCRNGCPLP